MKPDATAADTIVQTQGRSGDESVWAGSGGNENRAGHHSGDDRVRQRVSSEVHQYAGAWSLQPVFDGDRKTFGRDARGAFGVDSPHGGTSAETPQGAGGHDDPLNC